MAEKKILTVKSPTIIDTGCNFVVLLITIGDNIFPSRHWTTTIATVAQIPIDMLWEYATIKAGTAPIYGPA